MKTKRTDTRESFRFGIGEWYGRLFTNMTQEERKELVSERKGVAKHPCPFKF